MGAKPRLHRHPAAQRPHVRICVSQWRAGQLPRGSMWLARLAKASGSAEAYLARAALTYYAITNYVYSIRYAYPDVATSHGTVPYSTHTQSHRHECRVNAVATMWNVKMSPGGNVRSYVVRYRDAHGTCSASKLLRFSSIQYRYATVHLLYSYIYSVAWFVVLPATGGARMPVTSLTVFLS